MGLFTALVVYKSIKFVVNKIDEAIYRKQCNERLKVDNDNTQKIIIRYEYVDVSADGETKSKKNKKNR